MTFAFTEQLAGFSGIEFYLLTETSNWPIVLSDVNAGQITFDPEDNDVDGIIMEDTISINDKPKLGPEGTIWPIDIQFGYENRHEEMEQLLEQYGGQPGVAIACLQDGNRKLFGTDKEPIYLSWEIAYGEKSEDRAGTFIRIKGEQQQRPVYYNPE